MSIQDVTIQLQDRRDESPPKGVVIFNNLPDELTKQELEYLFKTALRQAQLHLGTEPTSIGINKLRAARDAGTISQAVFDALTE